MYNRYASTFVKYQIRDGLASFDAGIALAQKFMGSPKKNQDPFRTSETKFKGSFENVEGPIIMQNAE